jgi:hypothetical protein
LKRREDMEEKRDEICPLMKDQGYPDKICICDVPKELVPKGKCYIDGKCLAPRTLHIIKKNGIKPGTSLIYPA